MWTLYGIILSCLFLFGFTLRRIDGGTPRQAAGALDGSVTLKCPVNITSSDTLQWNDLVYNEARGKPALIYDSDSGMDSKHANAGYMSVENNELTITDLKEEDVGEYSCVVLDENLNAQLFTFNLNLYGNVECTGQGVFTEGDEVTLECEADVMGDMPSTVWKNGRGVLSDDQVKNKGDFFNPLLLEAKFKASYLDDGDTYTCVMSYMNDDEEVTSTCEVPFNVTYAARNAKVEPNQDVYAPGDVLTFSALGNPTPDLELEVPLLRTTLIGVGTISMNITEEMLNKSMRLVLFATNSLSKDPASFAKTFQVKEPPTTTPEPPPTTITMATPEPEETGGEDGGTEDGGTENGGGGSATTLTFSTTLFIFSYIIARLLRV